MTMATVELKDVTKSYGAVGVIRGIDLSIADGEFVVFVGPSGCGKSTLLRMIAGLEEISTGDVLIDGTRCNDEAPRERGIAMVFQSYALYPHKTAYGNMAFGLKLSGMGKSEIDVRIHEAARILKMEELLDRRPYQLSGGQRQRVAIGRAIVRHPKVFLFDEPLSNLDAALRVSMRREIAKLHSQLGSTMIYVTHDQVEAMTLADRIVVLNGGVVQQIGTPIELYERPRNLFVAGFIGSPKMNFIEGEITDVETDHVLFSSPDTGEVKVPVLATASILEGSRATLGFRPEHLAVDQGEFRIAATVRLIERLGDQSFLELETASGHLVVARVDASHPASLGSRLTLGCDASRLRLFDDEGLAL
jgi:multiple sugar transport system ATP-binding protein